MSVHETPTHSTEAWVLDATDGACPQCLIERIGKAEQRAEQAERALAEESARNTKLSLKIGWYRGVLKQANISHPPDDTCPCGRSAYEAVGDPLQDHAPDCSVFLRATMARVEGERDKALKRIETLQTLMQGERLEALAAERDGLRAVLEGARGDALIVRDLWHKCQRTGFDLLHGQEALERLLAALGRPASGEQK